MFLRSERNELKQAWGDWLDDLGAWQMFATLTLRDPPGYQGTWTKPGWRTAKRARGDFMSQCAGPLGQPYAVWCWEWQHDRGVPHLHGLVGGVGPEVRRMDLVDHMYSRWGIARVLRYDPTLGARFYLCKYITKELTHVDFLNI